MVSYGIEYSGAPVGSGEPRAAGFAEPVYYWDPVIAPGGMDFYDGGLFPDWRGDLLIASLGGALVRVPVEVGASDGEFVEVRGPGLAEGAMVALGFARPSAPLPGPR